MTPVEVKDFFIGALALFGIVCFALCCGFMLFVHYVKDKIDGDRK